MNILNKYFEKIGDKEALERFDFFMIKQKELQDEIIKINPDLKSNLSLFNLYSKETPLRVLNDYGFIPKLKLNKFIVCLTHDVDIIKPTLLFKLFHIKKNPKNLFNILLTRNFNTFKEIIRIENEYNANSTFFFLIKGKDKSILNYKKVNYDLNKEDKIINLLKENNREIGLHGGYWSFNDLEKIKKEKKEIERIIKERIISYRNHYLRFHIFNTWKYLSRTNFRIDSTFGWNDVLGFRNGWPYPFKPYDFERKEFINIVEFPLNIMDNTIFINKEQLKNAFLRIKNIIKKVKKVRGVLTINWHNNYFDERFYPGYKTLYKNILKLVSNNKGELLSLKDAYEKIKEKI